MGVTVQVRNLDPEVQETLKVLARSQGVSFSEYLRRTLTQIAERERVRQRWRAHVARQSFELERPENTHRRPIQLSGDEIAQAVREGRDQR